MMSKCPSKAGLCAALTVWIFLSIFILIATIMAYLRPFIQVMTYRHTMCHVDNIFYTTQFICPCGPDCRSSYPCFLVHVSLNTSNGQTWTVILYSDTEQQTMVAEAPTKRRERCSIMVCGKNSEENRQNVTQFQINYGEKGKYFPCYYAPWDIQGGAVVKRVHPGMAVLHAVLWPAISVILGLVLCVIFCRRCRQIEHLQEPETKNGNSSTKTETVTIPLQNTGENNVGNRDVNSSVNIESTPSRQSSAETQLIPNQRPTSLNPNLKPPLDVKKTDHAGKKRKQMSLRSLWMDVA